MAHERRRRSGDWKKFIAAKRYAKLLTLDERWLTALANNGQLLFQESKGKAKAGRRGKPKVRTGGSLLPRRNKRGLLRVVARQPMTNEGA